MTVNTFLAILALILVPLGGTWGVVKILLMQDRKRIGADHAALQLQQEELRRELGKAQEELATLRERIRNLPDYKALQGAMERLEERLEKKLDTMAERIQASLDSTLKSLGGTR